MPSLFEEEAKRIAALNKHKHMNSDEKSVGAAFLIVLGVIFGLACLWLYGIFAYGFVLSKMWAWFVIPIGASALGADINAIGILQAAAICMVIRFAWPTTFKINSNDERPTSDKVAEVFAAIFIPWAALFFAWILKGMM